MELPNEITHQIMTFMETACLLNFRSTCSQNNAIFKQYFTSVLIKHAKCRDVIVVKQYRNHYKFDETYADQSKKKFLTGFINNNVNTWNKWNDDNMVKIKVVIHSEIGEIFTCIVISPKGIRAKKVKFMIASYYMFAPADYNICDSFGYTCDPDSDYKITNGCESMFINRYAHKY